MDIYDAPTSAHDTDETCRLVAVDHAGREVNLAEVIRAVFDGTADPDDYRITTVEP